jgi:predicted RND superfamily exporter protein
VTTEREQSPDRGPTEGPDRNPDRNPDRSGDAPHPRWIEALASLVVSRPRTIVAISLVAALLGGLLGWYRLPLDADTNSLIARDRPWMQLYRAFLEEFGDLEYLYVVVDSKGDVAAGERAVDDLVERLRTIPVLPGVHGRIEPEEQLRLASRALQTDALADLARAAEAFPSLADPDRALADGVRFLDEAMDLRTAGRSEEERTALAARGIALLGTVAAAHGGDVDALAERPPSLADPPPQPVHLASDTGRLFFIGILPEKNFGRLAAIDEALRAIRGVIEEARTLHPTVEIGLTGKPVLQADELETSTGDTTRSFAIGLLLVAVLCVVVYRDVRRPMLAVLAFGMAILWTHGAAALLVGRLTLLSMVFMLVLIGAGLDYGIHVISRYTEHRTTRSVRDAVAATLRSTGIGTLTGAATSAAVFLLALLTSFQGLRELGIVAGAGLVLCALAMVTTLPALLVLFDREGAIAPSRELRVPGLVVGRSRRAAWTSIALFASLALASLAAAPFLLRFESNLLKLQSPSLESVQWEHRVLDDSSSLSWFAAVICDDEPSALAAIERAKTEPTIGHVRSVFDFMPPSTAERDALRNAIGAATLAPRDAPRETQLESQLESQRDTSVESPPIDAEALAEAARRLRTAATLGRARLSADEAARLAWIAAALEALARGAREDSDAVRSAIASSVAQARSTLAVIGEGARASLRDALPAAVRERLVSPNGRLLVSLVPTGDAWELEPLEAFVAAIRRVDPLATGVPITQSESIRDMTRAFVVISILSFIAVALITWFDFRSIRAVAIASGVLAVGIAVSVGVLAVFDVPLSLANFFGIPILIGLGIDSNIHLLHRAKEAAAGPSIELGATRSAVVFTALTTAIGFGGQIFASHRGMQDLGWIMVIGSLVCLATSIWLLPAVLRVLRPG